MMKIEIAGENALILYFGTEASDAVAAEVYAATQALRPLMGRAIVDLVPSYASILIVFNDHEYDLYGIQQCITQAFAQQQAAVSVIESREVILPVYYSQESGPDLAELAQAANLSIEQVIDLHQAQTYRVFAIGFAPGFAYLGEVDARIAAPRKATPRKAVPKGAVAIADRQTAVYPSMSPGGWNLIGLCPLPMFDADKTPTMPVSVGDRVRFQAITKTEFFDLGGQL